MAAIVADASLFKRMRKMKNDDGCSIDPEWLEDCKKKIEERRKSYNMGKRRSYVYINEATLNLLKERLPTENIEHSIDPTKGEVNIAIDSDEWGRWYKTAMKMGGLEKKFESVGKNVRPFKRIGGSDWSKKS